MDQTKQPALRIDQVLLVKAEFDDREDFLNLPASHHVEVEITIRTAAHLADDGKSGLLAIGVSTNKESNPVYRFHVEMAALISAEEPQNLSVEEYVKNQGSAMLMPFLRETVANLTGRGRFGPIWLRPLNLKAPDFVESPTIDAGASEETKQDSPDNKSGPEESAGDNSEPLKP